MTPITFNGCLGWLHHGSGDRGVVLCSPLGHEAVATHRGWRQLAETLARQGLHVLRFDYHGTGDSEGDDSDSGRLDVWLGNVEAAASLLRECCNVRAITLVGLRFGASLALLAAQGIADVEALALLAPVVSGRTYLRELRLLARVWHEQAFGKGPPPDTGGGLEVTGTRHSAETVLTLSKVDLRSIQACPPRVLVMDTGDRLEAKQLAERLSALGSDVDSLPFLGEASFLTEPVTSRIPYDAFSHLAAWIGRGQAGPDAALPVTWTPVVPLDFGQGTEVPLRFGPDNRLFGMLCRPLHPVVGGSITIMVNTGRSRHTGDARFYVTLARELARHGVASLRMDISGLGDSDSDPRVGETVLHDVGSCRDVSAAIDEVTTMGWTKASMIGVCSGAFLAFYTALSDPRVISVDLINQQRFLAGTEQMAVGAPAPLRRPAGFYARSLLRSFAWRAILSGQVDVLGIVLGVLRSVAERYARLLGRHYEMVTGRQTSSGAAHRLFRQLSERRVRVRLWYGATDPGWPELESWFGRGGTGLQRFRSVELGTLPDADHAFHSGEARARLTTLLCEKLKLQAVTPCSEPVADFMALKSRATIVLSSD